MALLLFAIPAVLALLGLYRFAARENRQGLRTAAVAVAWATILCLIITWS